VIRFGPNFFSGRLLSDAPIPKRPVAFEKLTIEPRGICFFYWDNNNEIGQNGGLPPDHTAKGVTFYKSVQNQVGEAVWWQKWYLSKRTPEDRIEPGGVGTYLSACCFIEITITGSN
jgi:hypothetical protein